MKKEFLYDNPLETFDAICMGKCSAEGLDEEAVANLMRAIETEYTDEEVH